jgi:hypothetical protein
VLFRSQQDSYKNNQADQARILKTANDAISHSQNVINAVLNFIYILAVITIGIAGYFVFLLKKVEKTDEDIKKEVEKNNHHNKKEIEIAKNQAAREIENFKENIKQEINEFKKLIDYHEQQSKKLLSLEPDILEIVNFYKLGKLEMIEEKTIIAELKLNIHCGTIEEQQRAIEALCQKTNPVVIPTLLACLNDSQKAPVIIAEALYGLKRKKDIMPRDDYKKFTDIIKKYIESENDIIRESALDVLKSIDPTALIQTQKRKKIKNNSL